MHPFFDHLRPLILPIAQGVDASSTNCALYGTLQFPAPVDWNKRNKAANQPGSEDWDAKKI
jgi:hypothetical protein